MSYFRDSELQKIKDKALKEAKRSCDDDLWDFVHSILMNLVERQGGKMLSWETSGGGCDGFYKMKEFDVNSGAEYIQVSLEVREQFMRERAENDKSG